MLTKIDEPQIRISFISVPEFMSLRLSFSRIDSTLLSSGDKSGLIAIEVERERRKVRLRTLTVELSVARSGLGGASHCYTCPGGA